MTQDAPEIVLCQYQAKAGKEAELLALFKEHDGALRRLGLITDEPAV